MIAFDLKCDQDHIFEGWFENSESFELQKKGGLVTCPICGSARVERILSTFGIARHRHQDNKPTKRTKPDPYEQLAKFIENNFENVGTEFAREALKMHYGATEQRNIRGVSTSQEEETLREEGISFFKLPLPADSAADED